MRGVLEPWHILVLVGLLFVLFGAKRMPDASRSLARSMKIFKSEIKDLRADDEPVTPEIASTPETAARPDAAVPSAGATAVTVPAAAPVTTPAASPAAAAIDDAELREAELRLAEARVNDLRARAAASAGRERDRV